MGSSNFSPKENEHLHLNKETTSSIFPDSNEEAAVGVEIRKAETGKA